jgi:tyrosyl-tRNA synthetase
MSKSLGNAIGLTDPPEQIYGRVMSIPDAVMPTWIRLLGLEPWQDLVARAADLEKGRGDPLRTKQELATRLVERFWGSAAAVAAAHHFRRVVQQRELPEDLPSYDVSAGASGAIGLLDVLRTALGVSSNGEGRRLVGQGAVEVNGAQVTDPTLRLASGTYVVRAGRRRVARVRIA